MFGIRITRWAAVGLAAGLLAGGAMAANCEWAGKAASLDAYVRLHQDAQGIAAVRDGKAWESNRAGKTADPRAAAAGASATPLPVILPVDEAAPARRAYAGGGRRLSGVQSY